MPVVAFNHFNLRAPLALTDALRAVTTEAASLAACTSELLVLAVWTVLSFVLALRLFRWQ